MFYVLWVFIALVLAPTPAQEIAARASFRNDHIVYRAYFPKNRFYIDVTKNMVQFHGERANGTLWDDYDRGLWVGFISGKLSAFTANMSEPWDGVEIEIRR